MDFLIRALRFDTRRRPWLYSTRQAARVLLKIVAFVATASSLRNMDMRDTRFDGRVQDERMAMDREDSGAGLRNTSRSRIWGRFSKDNRPISNFPPYIARDASPRTFPPSRRREDQADITDRIHSFHNPFP